MKEARKKKLIELEEKYNIKKGKRYSFRGKYAWYCTKFERLALNEITHYLRPLKSSLISDIYSLSNLKIIWPSDGKRRYAIKYLIMLMCKMNNIKVICNHGYKIIAWNHKKELKELRKATKIKDT